MPKIVIGIIITILGAVLVNRYPITESRLVHTHEGDHPFSVVDTSWRSNEVIVKATHKAKFTNYGLKRGHIENCKLVQNDLRKYPEVNVIFVEKAPISWWEEKSIECTFTITLIRGNKWYTSYSWMFYYYNDRGELVMSETATLSIH